MRTLAVLVAGEGVDVDVIDLPAAAAANRGYPDLDRARDQRGADGREAEYGRHLLGGRPVRAAVHRADGLRAYQAQQGVGRFHPQPRARVAAVAGDEPEARRIERHADRRADRGATGWQRQRPAVTFAVQVEGLVFSHGRAAAAEVPALAAGLEAAVGCEHVGMLVAPRLEDLLGPGVVAGLCGSGPNCRDCKRRRGDGDELTN